ncbi:unnamed protein product, partial [Laminaria digitata]
SLWTAAAAAALGTEMVLLAYSGGRGRPPPAREGSFSSGSRGRGGRPSGGRGRSMTWTNPASGQGRQQPAGISHAPPPPCPSAAAAATGTRSAPNFGGNRVWVNAGARGAVGGGRAVAQVRNSNIGRTSSSFQSPRGPQRSPPAGRLGVAAAATAPAFVRPSTAVAPHARPYSVGTFQGGNRVWTNNNNNNSSGSCCTPRTSHLNAPRPVRGSYSSTSATTAPPATRRIATPTTGAR